MKAVVLEVRRGEAAILTMDGMVRRVRGKYQVGEEFDYAESARPSAYRWIAAMLVAAILLAASAGLWINNNYVAYAEISLDAGPSIVYTLNRRNRVLTVEAVNEDAAAVIEGLAEVRFMPIGDAVEKTMDILAEEGYLSDDAENYVLAGVSADDEKTRETLSRQVEKAMSRTQDDAKHVEYQIERTNRETAGKARERGMTPARYAAWEEDFKDRAPEVFAEMPVREIMGRGATEGPKDEGQEHSESESAEQPAKTQIPADGKEGLAAALSQREQADASVDDRQMLPVEDNGREKSDTSKDEGLGHSERESAEQPTKTQIPADGKEGIAAVPSQRDQADASADDRQMPPVEDSGRDNSDTSKDEVPAQPGDQVVPLDRNDSEKPADGNNRQISISDHVPKQDGSGSAEQKKPSIRSGKDKSSSPGGSGGKKAGGAASSGGRGPGGSPGGR